MNEHEQKIRDLRILEAKRKDYMGLKGKFGVILKTMGEPLVRHTTGGGKFYTETLLDDYMNLEDDNLPTADTEERGLPDGAEWNVPENISMFGTNNEGWHFDGLSRGFPLEIWFKDDESEIKVLYKGTIVYRELGGDLKSYVPVDEWQQMIEKLYLQGRKLFKERQNEHNRKLIETKKRSKLAWVEKMKRLWGA
ncbi:MAG: hypothetical protein M0R80_08535 [Proteobacteria bacterium]|nr:hypothetical protein [Pseudomonadota bacterium]